jgi:hypothetical protein
MAEAIEKSADDTGWQRRAGFNPIWVVLNFRGIRKDMKTIIYILHAIII